MTDEETISGDKLLLPDFEAWLRKQAPDKIIGTRNCAGECPLSTWIEHDLGWSVWIQSIDFSWHDDPDDDESEECDNLPRWAAYFVALVDRGDTEEITAAQALRYLAEVRKTFQYL